MIYMATHTYWIPKNHDALHEQANCTWGYFSQQRERMGLASTTPQGQWIDEEFYPKLNHFNNVFLDWKDPAERAPVKTVKLREAEEAFKPAYRHLYTGFLKSNPLVTDSDLLEMSLPQRRQHVSNQTAALPSSFPVADVVLHGPGRVEFRIHDSATSRKAKPAGIHGVEIKWAILDVPPVEIGDMTQTSFFTKSPFILDFDFLLRGKTLYFVLCWENTRSEKGPWGRIQAAIIP
jgi:hypothetical protein